MSQLFIWEMVIFLVVLFLASGYCIYRNKRIISYMLEMLICISMIIVSNDIWKSKKNILIFICTFMLAKALLCLTIIFLKIRSFYWARDIAQGNAEKYYKRYNKKKFLKFVSNVRKIEYGPRLMYGEPARANQKDKTGIEFDKRGFPCFSVLFETRIGVKDYRKSREIHSSRASHKLYNEICKKKSLAKKLKLSKNEIEALKNGEVPSRFTWHHNQRHGVMQLVSYKIHSKVHHKGGFAIWGPR